MGGKQEFCEALLRGGQTSDKGRLSDTEETGQMRRN